MNNLKEGYFSRSNNSIPPILSSEKNDKRFDVPKIPIYFRDFLDKHYFSQSIEDRKKEETIDKTITDLMNFYSMKVHSVSDKNFITSMKNILKSNAEIESSQEKNIRNEILVLVKSQCSNIQQEIEDEFKYYNNISSLNQIEIGKEMIKMLVIYTKAVNMMKYEIRDLGLDNEVLNERLNSFNQEIMDEKKNRLKRHYHFD